jgi:putative transposase
MYTYEERISAVKLYIASGYDVAAVLNAVGYPSPNALRQWCREYEATGTLHIKVQRKDLYSAEQINAAVSYYAEHSGSLIGTCRALGYPDRNTLREWVHLSCPERIKSTQDCKTGRKLVRCSLEQKRAAVEEWMNGTPDYKVAAKYGVSRAAVYNWKISLFGKATKVMKKPDEMPLSSEMPNTVEELKAELKATRAELFRTQLERDILEKSAEVLKKDVGTSLEQMTNAEKREVIGALNEKYKLSTLLKALKMAKSSYFYQKKASQCEDKYFKLRETVRDIFEENYECYGYRRIHESIKLIGQVVSEKVIRRIMRENALKAHCARRKRYNSYAGEISPAVGNILNRDFHAELPNQKWLTDITEFALPAGKVYLSPIIDCFDGIAVSWSIGTSPNAMLSNTMLDKAVALLREDELPLVHSDRGGHYRWPGWIERMERAHLTRSMSKKGCSPDNSACEGFFGRLKNEMFYGRDWMGVSTGEFISKLDAYIRWYNEKRIKLSLGGMSPLEYRRSLGFA